MTTEQLNQARAEVWHQTGNPLMTADDAAAWLRETGVCLFLPRTQQFATAAPSFVEAVLGASDATPPREAIENATRLLERLLASGDAVALNLLNTPGEQPDFLATTETLPFLFALVGDKEWKRGPRGKSSPLVIEVWKLLDRESPLTTIEVKEKLERQLTEAAALRALTELWSHLRIEPVLKESEPARWQLLEQSREKQMKAGSTMSQAVALSALVSLYLQSAVAATADEVEIFLSPFASRSKVRDAVRGLTATRQLSTLNLGPLEMFHVEGSLPEFSEIERPEGAVLNTGSGESGEGTEGGMGEGRRRFVAKRLAAETDASAPPAERSAKPASYKGKSAGSAGGPSPARPSAAQLGAASRSPKKLGTDKSSADRRPFAPRPGTTGGERKPYGTRSPGGSSFNPREPWNEDRKSPAPSAEGEEPRLSAKGGEEAAGERQPFAPREDGGRKQFAPRTGDQSFKPRSGTKPFGERRTFGDRKPFTPREGGERKLSSPGAGGGERKTFTPHTGEAGERKPFAPRSGDHPFKPRSDNKPFGERKSFGDRKPFTPREGGAGDSKPFTPRAGGAGERKSFAPRSGDRPFKPRSDNKPFGERKSFGDRKPFTPRESGERKPFPLREGGDRRSFAPRSGDRPFKPRSDAKPFGERKSFGDRKSFTPREGGERKPFTPREGGDRKSFVQRSGDRPFKPRSDAKPFGERKSFGDRKPFTPREGAERKPYAPREGGGKPFAPRGGARPFKPHSEPRSGSRSESNFNDRPPRPSASGEGRPSRPRPPFGTTSPGARKATGVRKTTGAGRARTSPMTSSGKPRSGVRPPLGRPGPRATRAGSSSAPGRIKRTPRPGKGRSK